MLNGMATDIPLALSRQARCQGGVVTRGQAARAGMSPAQIAWLVKCGTWRRVHRSVYATFTGPLTRTALLWAAVLCAGKGAYLSHETAAELNRLTDNRAPEIHLTIPEGRRVRPIKGVVIHESAQRPLIWRPPDVPPYTVPAATVIDLVQLAATGSCAGGGSWMRSSPRLPAAPTRRWNSATTGTCSGRTACPSR